MRQPPEKNATQPASAGERGDEAVALARTRARRRLVGALVLLGAGVGGFPLLFETQPRGLPADLPIVAAGASAAVPPAAPGASGRASASPPAVVALGAATSGAGTVAPEASVAASSLAAAGPAASGFAASGATREAASSAPAHPIVTAVPAPAKQPSSAAPAPAVGVAASPRPASRPLEPTVAAAEAHRAALPRPGSGGHAAATPVAAEGRFVVQVGAFSDAATLREARQRVEKLGLKTYTQVIEGDGARRTRVRVGPFATRTEAQAAAARLKAAGLPANLLSL